MTDRIHSLTVVLERDNRSDDVEALANAIRMFHGVLSVEMHVSDISSHMAEERAMMALRKKVYEALEPQK
jgi:hypothetical protein